MDGARDEGSEENAPSEGRDTVPVSPADRRGELAPGTSLGPFVIERELGRGGAGVVLAAFDPELRRRVAVKLLHATQAGITTDRRARFLREAQALARLSHPHVMTVYQVGSVGDQVFIAMELIEGTTLRGWLAAARRPWREVVDAFVRAGRGLAAAHRAGLVHRDFKPDNVLRGDDGRVLVTDFGLVGVTGDGPSEDITDASPLHGLTDTGAVLGTPRYMAPEQHVGDRVDARADQFSFCTALFEGLFGVLPFEGDTLAELRQRVRAGKIRPIADRRGVPRRVVAALERGLALEPAARFPTMDALLARLVPRGRARLALVTTAVASAAVAAGLWSALGAAPCGGAARKLAGVWDDARRTAVRTSFLATGRPYAEDTARRVTDTLDRYAFAWTAMRDETCEATAVRREQSAALLDARMACLDRRLGGLSALARLLSGPPDPELVDRAVAAAQELESLDGCADSAALLGAPRPRPEAAASVTALEARLDEARALAVAGKSKAAVELLTPLADEARAAGYAPLLAETTLRLGMVEVQLLDAGRARSALDEAVASAAEAGDDVRSAMALLMLMHVYAVTESKPAEALALRSVVEGTIRRAGNPAALLAMFHERMGGILVVEGRFGAAANQLEIALSLRQGAPAHNDVEIARTLATLARALVKDGQYDAARTRLEAALRIVEKAEGPDHPDVANAYSDLATLAFFQHRVEEGLSAAQRALAILSRAMGEDSLRTLGARHDLANLLDEAGRTEEAVAMYEQVLAARVRALGPDHVDVAKTHQNLAICLIRVGRPTEARPHLERAVAIFEQRLGPDHPDVGTAVMNLGNLLADLEDWDAARARLERALAIRKKALRPDHPYLAQAMTALAVLHIQRGRYADAIPLLEDALAIVGARPEYAVQAARARLGLARALHESGGDRARAAALAREARATFVAHKLSALADRAGILLARIANEKR